MATLRADARRNLDRVLDAAAEAFAEHGPDVSMDAIARRAGVGHGTIFRRFPTKEALIAAIVSARLEQLSEAAGELLGQKDAGAAFEAFVWRVAELHARDRALFEGMPRCRSDAAVADAKRTLLERVAELVSQAQREGSLRADLRPEDVPVLIGSALLGSAQSGDPEAWRRYVAVVLDGLRR